MNPEQSDVSIKLLLKQVYVAHSAKVKGLENEVEELKCKLFEAERKLKENDSDCKRCAELEDAFKSCQTALHEQSKWFENIGQKFSVFNQLENKASSKKTAKLSNNISEAASEISSGPQFSEKSSFSRQNFLKNLISLNSIEYQDSLDLCTAPFPVNLVHEYSTLNSDSLILAPDTMDIGSEIQCKRGGKQKNLDTDDAKLSKTTNKKDLSIEHKNKTVVPIDQNNKTRMPIDEKNKTAIPIEQKNKTVELIEQQSKKGVDVSNKVRGCQETTGQTKKRSLFEYEGSDSNAKRPSIGNESELKKSKLTVIKSGDPKQTSTQSDTFNSKPENLDNAAHTNSKNIPKLDVEICKEVTIVSYNDKSPEAVKSSRMNEVVAHRDTISDVSPSLLPVKHKKDKIQPINQHLGNEDIDDFQTPVVNKKHSDEEGSWTVCNKKIPKNHQGTKLKSTSKFKMSLDSLPPNYKKPKFRQTKLSKSIFKAKPNASNGNTLSFCNENMNDGNIGSISSNKNPVKSNGKGTTMDFDATFIPDNYEYQITASENETCTEKEINNDGDKSIVLSDSEVTDDESSNESSIVYPGLRKECQDNKASTSNSNEDKKEEVKFEDFHSNCKKVVSNESMNSFDRLPKAKEPNYKYKEETVRKKAERKQLNGFDCKECEKYYAELGLSDKEKQERLKQCSRHRSKFAPPPTPEHFWELEFPDTQECKARGYLNETQKVKLKTHRRRPL